MMNRFQRRRHVFELCVFAMLGTVMFCSKVLMELLPNIHLLGMLTMVYTLVYRAKALIPIYLYVFLNGIYAGFDLWWMPYLYVWTVLWGITMLLPRRISPKAAAAVYPIVCAIHGLLFGLLYLPAWSLMYNFNFQQSMNWYLVGISYDIIHMIGNFVAGLLILPLSKALEKLNKQYIR